MSMTTFQKVTLISCLVLCVSLLLPKVLLSRGRKEGGQREAGPGRFPPPMTHRQQMSESQAQWGGRPSSSKAYKPDGVAKGAGTGGRAGGKSNLMGQIIPIYGFGILLYILYILFKLTSRGKNVKTENRFNALKSENLKRKITDYELAQLQEKLKETEEVMERIVSNAGHSPDRVRRVTAEHEEKLLRQLKEITRVMKESQLVDGVSLGSGPQEEFYAEDWGDEPKYGQPCCRRAYHTTTSGKPDSPLQSTEELCEGVNVAVEEAGLEGELRPPGSSPHDTEVKWEELEATSPGEQVQNSRKQIGISRDPTESVDEEDEEEDLEVKLERMGFADVQDDADGFLHTPHFREGDDFSSAESQITTEMGFGVFRKRSKRQAD